MTLPAKCRKNLLLNVAFNKPEKVLTVGTERFPWISGSFLEKYSQGRLAIYFRFGNGNSFSPEGEEFACLFYQWVPKNYPDLNLPIATFPTPDSVTIKELPKDMGTAMLLKVAKSVQQRQGTALCAVPIVVRLEPLDYGDVRSPHPFGHEFPFDSRLKKALAAFCDREIRRFRKGSTVILNEETCGLVQDRTQMVRDLPNQYAKCVGQLEYLPLVEDPLAGFHVLIQPNGISFYCEAGHSRGEFFQVLVHAS